MIVADDLLHTVYFIRPRPLECSNPNLVDLKPNWRFISNIWTEKLMICLIFFPVAICSLFTLLGEQHEKSNKTQYINIYGAYLHETDTTISSTNESIDAHD